MPTLFETESPIFDQAKTQTHGKIFTLDHDTNASGRIDIEDLQWNYLEGDGDFRSKEICKLRDEADIIVTNPPFSLFREFITWIMEAGKQFIIIGNMNAITYKEVFPLIKGNQVWLGNGFKKGNAYFRIVNGRDFSNGVYDAETGLVKFRNCCWFTNIDHGRRHQPLELMSMAHNFKHSKHKEIRGRKEYIRYANYDAIEIPFTDAIPDDYPGVMGVPSSFVLFIIRFIREQVIASIRLPMGSSPCRMSVNRRMSTMEILDLLMRRTGTIGWRQVRLALTRATTRM